MTRASVKIARRALVAGIALSAMGALAAVPAAAGTANLYSYVVNSSPTGFATLSRTNADVTRLAASTPASYGITGVEVFNGVGTAIGGVTDFSLITWDVATGAIISETPLFVTGADADSVDMSGLDTLADGTVITIVTYAITVDGPDPVTTQFAAVATINRTTGELVPLIDVQPLREAYEPISLATDPISGTTYLFLSAASGSYFSALDFGAGVFNQLDQFTGTGFESGAVLGADFDSDGTLYFIYANNNREQYELSSIGSPAGWETAARTFIGDAGSNLPDQYPLGNLALTVGSPVLASTGVGFPVVWLVAGTVAVLGGVVSVVTVSRRRRAA